MRDKSVNVLDKNMLKTCERLFGTVESLVQNTDIRAVVLFSLKDKGFIAGADIDMLSHIDSEEQAREISQAGHRLLNRFEKLPLPTIAATHGSCLGGGLEVALACSHRLCTKHKSTQIGLPEVKLGLIPGCGGTVRLPRLIGLQSALELILQGSSVNAQKALRLGIVDDVHAARSEEPEQLMASFFAHTVQYALGLCRERFHNESKYGRKEMTWKDTLLQSNLIGRFIIERLARSTLDATTNKNYPAPYVILDSVMREFTCTNLQQACDIEAHAFGRLAVTPEAKNLMGLFHMTEEAKKVGNHTHEKLGILPERIAVVGAGIMGSSIAQFSLYKGFDVYLKDIGDDNVRRGLQDIEALFQRLISRRKLTSAEVQSMMDKIESGTSYDPIADADIVIESAVEVLAVKQQILADVEFVHPNVVFATTTSSIPISAIAENARRKENVVGMHFFAPVYRMPLVEIVTTAHTSRSALATVFKLAVQLGKVPIIVQDAPGFFTTRMFTHFAMEALSIALDGYPVERLDELLIRNWMPNGAFCAMDINGLDSTVHVISIVGENLGIGRASSMVRYLQAMVNAGAVGKKAGRGFYMYSNDDQEKKKKRMGINQGAVRLLHAHRSPDHVTISDKDAIDRCIFLMINEATRCLQEGIVSQPVDVDLGMVLGFGFAPYTGGLLHYADSISIARVCTRLEELAAAYGPRFEPSALLRQMESKSRVFFPDHIYPPPENRINVDNIHGQYAAPSKL